MKEIQEELKRENEVLRKQVISLNAKVVELESLNL
jgi:hypothetical protein